MPRFVFHYQTTQAKDLLTACAEKMGQLPETQVTLAPAKPMTKQTTRSDATLTLTHGGQHARYAVEMHEQVGATTLPHRLQALKAQATRDRVQPCLLARYINPNIAARLRQEAVAYADVAGNLYFCTPFFYALREGAKALPRPEPEARIFHTPAGLRLLGLLLVKPEAANWPYRELARAAAVAVGTVHDLLGQLREEGHLQRTGQDQREVGQPKDMLDRWLLGYRQRLRPKLLRGRYRTGALDNLADRLNMTNQGALLGGELAAAQITGLLNPQRAAIHVPVDLDLPELAKRLRLLPDAQGNVDVLTLPGLPAHWTRPGAHTPPLAAPMLIYAELLTVDDDRLREIATVLYEKEIAPHVQLS